MWVSAFRNIFSVPSVRRRILFTLFIFAVFRLISHLPIPVVNLPALQQLLDRYAIFGFFNLFSGGGLQNFSIAALGLNPYINASIIIQLLTMVFPKLEELSKEGEYGRERINQYTRFLAVPLSALQGYATYALFQSQGIVTHLDPFSLMVLIITLTAGTVFLMWLGELVSEYGIGNGISMIILGSILSGVVTSVGQSLATLTPENFLTFGFIIGGAVLLIAAVVFINEGVRRIPVQYARRVRGSLTYQTQSTYLPLRVNQAGMIPIIFALSLILLPTIAARFIGSLSNPLWQDLSRKMLAFFDQSSISYNVFYFLAVVAFTYFYTAVTFNPEKISGEIKKYGGFIPGIRPGRPTTDYLSWVLVRVTLAGAVFLGAVAVIPSLLSGYTNVFSLTIGGSSILIVVSVILETLRQVDSLMVVRDYEGFLQ